MDRRKLKKKGAKAQKPRKKRQKQAGTGNKVPKTVKLCSEELAPDEFLRVQDEFNRYGSCKNVLFDRLCGIKNMAIVEKWKNVRDMIRKEEAEYTAAGKNGYQTLEARFGLQNRHVVMAIQDVCQCVNSMWTNLGNKCKAKLRENYSHLSAHELSYCLYVFSSRSVWAAIVNGQEPKWSKNAKQIIRKITDTYSNDAAKEKAIKRLDKIIRRLTRKYKPHPQARKARCMLLDEMMYSITNKDGKDYISFTSLIPRKRETFRLHGNFCYSRSGNIQLILNQDRHVLEIHKCILATARPVSDRHVEAIGVDKGYSTLVSCSSEKEYGKDFGPLISKEAERVNARNTHRNYFIGKVQDMEDELEAINSKKRQDPRGSRAGQTARQRHQEH